MLRRTKIWAAAYTTDAPGPSMVQTRMKRESRKPPFRVAYWANREVGEAFRDRIGFFERSFFMPD
jgi:hypothetical protein